MSAEIKAAVEDVNKAFEAFKAANDERLKEIEKGFEDVITAEKVDRINADITELQSAVDEFNKKADRFALDGAGDDHDPVKAEYNKFFSSWFRTGENESELKAKQGEIMAAASVHKDADGGYLVPEEMASAIDRVLGTVSALRGLAQVITIGTDSYKKLVSQGGATSGWVGETASRTETNTPTLVEMAFPAMEVYANPAATQKVLDDSRVSIEQWLADEVSIQFAEAEGTAFVSGTGVDQPRGIVSYDTVANASYSWGNVGYIASGAASTLGTSNQLDKFLDLVHALKSGYRVNGRWLMNDSTINTVRQFKDGEGNYHWQPSVQAGQPPLFLGYPVSSDDNMQDVGADNYPVAFGDFRRAYLIVDRAGIRVLRDPYTNKPYVHFYTTKRVGGGIQNFEALKLLKVATS